MTQPTPIALCIEDLDAAREDRRYLQCVALAGNLPGLTLDAAGEARWEVEGDEGVALELWISADDCLMLLRPDGAPPSRLERAGRGLDVPEAKPVELIDGDEITLGARQLRLHVHGPAGHIAAPSWLEPEPEVPELSASRGRSRAAGTAAAMALGAAVALGGFAGDGYAGAKKPPKEKKPPVRVRPAPPKPAPPPPPPKKPTKPKPDKGKKKPSKGKK